MRFDVLQLIATLLIMTISLLALFMLVTAIDLLIPRIW